MGIKGEGIDGFFNVWEKNIPILTDGGSAITPVCFYFYSPDFEELEGSSVCGTETDPKKIEGLVSKANDFGYQIIKGIDPFGNKYPLKKFEKALEKFD